MNRDTSTLTTIASTFMLIAILFQIARVGFGDAVFLSALNQMALVVFTATLLRFSLRHTKRSITIVIINCHAVLLLSIFWHAFNGKDILVLTLGHVDNLKFLLVLSLALLIPNRFWALNQKGMKLLNLIWRIIALGVLFSVLQQIFPSLAELLTNQDEKKELYRHGLLRVPSFFSEINAFASLSFLLIPLALILNRNITKSIVIASIGILMAFSRQFILGIVVSAILATFLLYTEKWAKTLRLIVSTLIVTCAFLFISLFEISIMKSGADDGLLTITDRYIRTAVAATSIEVIKDKPIFGVGTGHFGGNIGKKFGITNELYGYGLLNLVPYFDLEGAYYTDTLWPQLLAEYGLAGLLAILGLFSLWYRRLSSTESKKHRFVATVCFFQFIFSAFTSPIFNFIYFSVSILALTLMISSIGSNIRSIVPIHRSRIRDSGQNWKLIL